MAKSPKYTDLSDETPGPRAEHIELGSQLPGGLKLNLKSITSGGSPLQRLVATLIATVTIVVLGCACTITLCLVGMHGWTAVSGLLFPPAVCLAFAYGLRPGRLRKPAE